MSTDNCDKQVPCYTTPQDYERAVEGEKAIILTPYNVNNIVFELVRNWMLANDPEELGYRICEKYTTDCDSGIYLNVGYDWDPKTVGKRPAVIVRRGAAQTQAPTMGQNFELCPPESQKRKNYFIAMPLFVQVIGKSIGHVEQLAAYLSEPFLQFEEQIRCDFRLRRFRLLNITEPSIFKEDKEHFIVVLHLDIVFDQGWIIKGDDLKLKTVSKVIFESICSEPLENQ